MVGLRYSRRDDFCNVSSDFLATLGATFCAEGCGAVTAVGVTEAATLGTEATTLGTEAATLGTETAILGTLATILGAVGTMMAAAVLGTASVFLMTGLVALAVLVFGRLFDPLPTIWGPACTFFAASEAEAAAATTAAAVAAAAEGVAVLRGVAPVGTAGATGVVGRCTDTGGGCCEVTVAAGGC